VRKGIGEGRVEGTGVRRPFEGDEALRLILSTLDRLLSLLSSGVGLSARFIGTG